MKINLSLLYTYLFSALGLILVLIGTVSLLQVVLEGYLSTSPVPYYEKINPVTNQALTPAEIETNKKDALDRELQYRNENKNRKMVNSIPMILVGLPLYLYHWRKSQKYA